MAISGTLARVKVSGSPVAMTDEPTTMVITNKSYQITNAAKRVIPKASTIVVEVGGVLVTSGYTVNRMNGTVTFDTTAVRTVTITADYHPMSLATEAKEFSITINAESIDITRFVDAGWMSKTQGLKSAEASVSEFFNTDQYFATQLVAGNIVVLELYPDGINPISMFALITSGEITSAVAGVSENSVSFEATDSAYISYM